MATDIVDVPIKNGGSFRSYVSHYQGGISVFGSCICPMIFGIMFDIGPKDAQYCTGLTGTCHSCQTRVFLEIIL